ncbi:MAG: PfkB family carbohydrate kinase [Paracoccaceae bacterium]
MPRLIPNRTDAHLVDALIIGRAGLDLYPTPAGTKTCDAENFMTDMGGSAGNIAAAMARQGAQVALAAPVSDDPVGKFVRNKLAVFGIQHVDAANVDNQARTSLALAELVDQGSETVIYRNNAADFSLSSSDLDTWIDAAPLTVVTGTALAREPSRTACLDALTKSECGVLDLDYRPYSWASQDSSARVYQAAGAEASIIVGNDEEFAVFAPGSEPRETAAGLAAKGKTVIFKEGAKGCTAMRANTEPLFVPPYPVDALKPFGAGDAFLGTALVGLSQGLDLEDALRNGAAAAALVVQRPGCASAMPDQGEVQAFRHMKEAS